MTSTQVEHYLNTRARDVLRLASAEVIKGPPHIMLQADLGTTRFGGSTTCTGPGEFLIRIRYGTLDVLSTLYMRLFAHREFLPDIGQAHLEDALPPLVDYFSNIDDLRGAGPTAGEDLEFVSPKCELRQHYAFLLMLTSMDVVFAHEVVHVLHGHAAYLRAAEERTARKPSDNEYMALEYDADVVAVGLALRTSLDWFMTHDGPVRAGFSLERTIRDLALALSMTFIVEQHLIRSNPVLLHYPPVRVRQRVMLTQLIRCATARGLSEDSALACVVKGTMAADVGYHLLTQRVPDFGLDGGDSPIGRLESYWATIQPELLNFAYKRIAAVV